MVLRFDCVYTALAAALRTIQFTSFLFCALDRIYRQLRSFNRPRADKYPYPGGNVNLDQDQCDPMSSPADA